MEGNINMSAKEAERIAVMENLIAKRIKQKYAAGQLDISVRQTQRLIGKYKKDGVEGLTHKSRGRKGNRAINQKEKDRAIDLIRKYYPDFGPTFALEKLSENHGILFGVDTLRKEMIAANLWKAKSRKINDIHPYRERRACTGELIQLDGSPHRWFEDRAPSCTLIAFIDDATSQIMDGMFVDFEGTWTLFETTEHYLKTHGKPLAFYVDKHSTFKINRQANVEEELKDQQAQSQFTRAMDSIGIEVICANSPEAKGRVERLFETLQDRLVKEMRLKGISTKDEATKYFREIYIPIHNSKFAVLPKEKVDLHRPLLAGDDLARILTIRSKRMVSRNLAVQYKNTRYQLIPENGYRYTLRNTGITVVEDRNGKISFIYKDKTIPHQLVVEEVRSNRPIQVISSKGFKEDLVRIPGWDHPWRKAGRLAIELAKQDREGENGATVLTGSGIEINNPIIGVV